MRKSIDGLMAIVRDTYELTPYSNSLFLFAGDAVTGSKRCISKNYPQLFVIRIFLPFILRYARFPKKICG